MSTPQEVTIHLAADPGTTFDSCAFAGSIGKTIPIAVVDGDRTHGILRSALVAADGQSAALTFEVAHPGESMRGRIPLDLSGVTHVR